MPGNNSCQLSRFVLGRSAVDSDDVGSGQSFLFNWVPHIYLEVHLTSSRFLHETVCFRQRTDTLSVLSFSGSMDVLSSIWIFPALPFLCSHASFNMPGWRLTYLWIWLSPLSLEFPWRQLLIKMEVFFESSRGLSLSSNFVIPKGSKLWLSFWLSSWLSRSSRSGVGEFKDFDPGVCADRCDGHEMENFRLFCDSCMLNSPVCSNCTLDNGTSRHGETIRGFIAR